MIDLSIGHIYVIAGRGPMILASVEPSGDVEIEITDNPMHVIVSRTGNDRISLKLETPSGLNFWSSLEDVMYEADSEYLLTHIRELRQSGFHQKADDVAKMWERSRMRSE